MTLFTTVILTQAHGGRLWKNPSDSFPRSTLKNPSGLRLHGLSFGGVLQNDTFYNCHSDASQRRETLEESVILPNRFDAKTVPSIAALRSIPGHDDVLSLQERVSRIGTCSNKMFNGFRYGDTEPA